MTRKRLFLAALAAWSHWAAWGQTITGTVTDAATGEGIVAATVRYSSGAHGLKGVTTDPEGHFSIPTETLPTRLTISCTGYHQQDITVYDDEEDIAVALTEQRNRLGDVVVVGYGTQSRTQLTGSVATISADLLEDFPAPTLDAALGGAVTGVDVTASGQLFVREGPIMAGMATLAYHIVGRGGHVSRPDKSVNPVFAAADVLTSISIAWNNQRDLERLVTLGVTQLQGGQVYNVIPGEVFIGGSLRFFDREAGEHALQLVKDVSEHVAAAHGCTVSYTDRMRVDLPPVCNDTLYTRQARQALERLFPGHVTSDPQYVWYGSETFALYSQLAPTVFTLVGVSSTEVGSTAQHHNDRFDLDEDALQYGVGAMTQFVVSQSHL